MSDEPVDLYSKLTARFEQEFHDRRGGVEITYISGEQVVSRLNKEIGVLNWSFRVVEHGHNPESDEMWVLGELVVYDDDRVIARQQFGSDKIQRSRSTGMPLDIGFDLKSAATDALKKCASLYGVGLYLSEHRAQPTAVESRYKPLVCQADGCGKQIQSHEFTDGTYWSVQEIVERGKKYNKVLCYTHLREAASATTAAAD